MGDYYFIFKIRYLFEPTVTQVGNCTSYWLIPMTRNSPLTPTTKNDKFTASSQAK